MICRKCGIDKPFDSDNFPNNKLSANGLEKRCKDCKYSYFKSYREANPDKVKYVPTDHSRKWHAKHRSNKMKNDPVFRASFNARERARIFAKKGKGYSRTLGCSIDTFRSHIEGLFKIGMSWDNYGKWHLDHKYPLSKAEKEGPEVFARACLYTNLQPLWAKENRSKSNK